MAEIVFWERSIGAKFPPYMSAIPLHQENIGKAENWKPFEQDGLKIDFAEDAHNCGAWATKPGQPGQCRVTFDLSA